MVDVGPLLTNGAPGERQAAAELRATFETYGFAYVANHAVPQALVDGVFAASHAFHALPLDAKLRIKMNEAHRGYMPFSTSTIVTSSVARVTKPNQSESFMMMHELAPDDPDLLAGKPLQGPNQWPDELPGFKPAVLAYNDALEALARRLMRALALGFDLPAEWFDPHFRRPTTFLRLLHYPPLPADAEADLYSSAPHTDYGFITILAQDQTGGLEVRARDGGWIAAPPIPGAFVVNVADILMRWSNDILLSTPHRVRNVAGRDRYSAPFFFDPSMDCMVEALPGAVRAGESPRWPTVRYGDYLMERLDKNYVYRQKPA